MDLSIVILSFNTIGLTINCINSVVDQYKEELNKGKFEIIVVDNGSTDESPKEISKLNVPNLKLIENKENLGFSKGCNLGAEKAKGENLLFLNSDTEVKDQGLLKMIEYLQRNENVGVLGGKLKNSDGTAQFSVGNFYSLPKLMLMLLGIQRFGFLMDSPSQAQGVDWVSGASLMIRRKVFDKIGGFEEKLFMYMEDVELCYKAKNKGFSTYFFPDVLIFHKERGSSDRTFAVVNIYKGILFFYKKHKPYWQYQIAKLMLFAKAVVLRLLGFLTSNAYYKKTYGEALKLF